MKAIDVYAFATTHLDDLKYAFGLEDWRIEISCGVCTDTDALADVSVNEDAHFAHITINPDKHPDTKELSDTLLHEFGHVLLGPFGVFADTVLESSGGKLKDAYVRLRTYSREAGVRNLLRLLKRWEFLTETTSILSGSIHNR